jgi:hypothetical protein
MNVPAARFFFIAEIPNINCIRFYLTGFPRIFPQGHIR